MYVPMLEYIADGNVYTSSELEEFLAKRFSLTNVERQERLSGGALTFCNRIGWAKTYLKKAGLVVSPRRGAVQITEEGRAALQKAVPIDNDYLASYASFQEFQNRGTVSHNGSNTKEDSPQDTLEKAYMYIRQTLVDDILTEIMRQSPVFSSSLSSIFSR